VVVANRVVEQLAKYLLAIDSLHGDDDGCELVGAARWYRGMKVLLRSGPHSLTCVGE